MSAHAGAVAILRAATYRSRGYRAWEPGGHFARLSAPSRDHMGWYKLGWSCPDMKRGLDIARHRAMAKNIAHRLITAWQEADGNLYESEATWEKAR